jgi:hypothetical protein
MIREKNEIPHEIFLLLFRLYEENAVARSMQLHLLVFPSSRISSRSFYGEVTGIK